MDNNLKNALNKEQVIPELRISELTLLRNSLIKRKCTDLDNNQYNVVDKNELKLEFLFTY